MTEEEAKTKTCHRTLALMREVTGELVFNPQSCIGSACMAWRADVFNHSPPVRLEYAARLTFMGIPVLSDTADDWAKGRIEAEKNGYEPDVHNDRRHDVPVWWRKKASPTQGFCGLAGKP